MVEERWLKSRTMIVVQAAWLICGLGLYLGWGPQLALTSAVVLWGLLIFIIFVGGAEWLLLVRGIRLITQARRRGESVGVVTVNTVLAGIGWMAALAVLWVILATVAIIAVLKTLYSGL